MVPYIVPDLESVISMECIYIYINLYIHTYCVLCVLCVVCVFVVVCCVCFL